MRLGSARLFDIGAEIYSGMNSQPAWQRSCARLAAHFPALRDPVVLDLGCGPGFSTFATARVRPDAQVLGLDLAPRMLRQAAQRLRQGHLRRPFFLQGDAARLPFCDSSVDVVTGHSFLYLVDEPESVLSEARRVLKQEGRIVLMEPNDRSVPLRQVLRHSRDVRFLFSVLLWRPYSKRHGRFSAATLGATLAIAGFDGFDSEEVLGGLGLIGWASRSG